MDIQIRLAKLEELETILNIQTEAIRAIAVTDYTQAEIEAIVKTQAEVRGNKEIILVAEVNEIPTKISPQIIGFACLSFNSAWIHGIYVHPDRTRQKIGTTLLQAIENEAINEGYKRLCVTSSLNAIRFYQANGYIKNMSSQLQLNGLPISVVMMSKRLIPLTREEKILRILAIGAIALILLVHFPIPFVILTMLWGLHRFLIYFQ